MAEYYTSAEHPLLTLPLIPEHEELMMNHLYTTTDLQAELTHYEIDSMLNLSACPPHVPDTKNALLNFGPDEPDRQSADLFGCLDDEEEARQLMTGLMETEEEFKGLLAGVSLSDLLDPPHNSPSDNAQTASLEYLLSLPSEPLESQYNTHSINTQPCQQSGLHTRTQHHCSLYSATERELVLINHPLFRALKHFIQMKRSRLDTQTVKQEVLTSCGDSDIKKEPTITTDASCFHQQPQLCIQNPNISYYTENVTTGFPVADHLMNGAMTTAIQLSTSDRFTDIMERAEDDCTSMLTSVSSFCQSILKSAENDYQEENRGKENNVCSRKSTRNSTKPLKVQNLPDSENTQTKKISVSQKKKRDQISKHNSDILRQWLIEHADHPYPDDDEKMELCMRTNLTLAKLNQWFINGRRRVLASIGLHVPKSKR